MGALAGIAGVLASGVNSTLCFATLISPLPRRTWRKAADGRVTVRGRLSGGKLKSRKVSLKFGSSSVSKTVRESPPDESTKNLPKPGASRVAAGGLGSNPRPSGASFCCCANAALEATAAIPAAMTKSLGMEFPPAGWVENTLATSFLVPNFDISFVSQFQLLRPSSSLFCPAGGSAWERGDRRATALSADAVAKDRFLALSEPVFDLNRQNHLRASPCLH
jgi:hypothetical protein